jgi:hypothetical protein
VFILISHDIIHRNSTNIIECCYSGEKGFAVGKSESVKTILCKAVDEKHSAEIHIRFIDEVLTEVNIKLGELIKMSKHYNPPFLSDEKITRLN